MFGFIRVGAASLLCEVAAPMANARRLTAFYKENCTGWDVAVFPELCLSSKNCGDLFFQKDLQDGCLNALKYVMENTSGTLVVGLPVAVRGRLYNFAAIICDGRLAGLVPKYELSHAERRWFSLGGELGGDNAQLFGEEVPAGMLRFSLGGCKLALELGGGLAPVSGANIILNPFGERLSVESESARETALAAYTAGHLIAFAQSGCDMSESTNEASYNGQCYIFENGGLLARSESFAKNGSFCIADIDFELLGSLRQRSELQPYYSGGREIELCHEILHGNGLLREISPAPFIPKDAKPEFFKRILDIQTAGLYKKLSRGIKKSVIGVSGGLDSTLALVCLARSYDFMGLGRDNIIAVTMPGFGTSGRTYKNAHALIDALNVAKREISIKEACELHLADIGYKNDGNVAFENAQARERTQILMDLANIESALVIGTGDMSEACLGFSTYNGDQMSMYNLNGGIPKTVIAPLLKYAAGHEFPELAAVIGDICDTPISPELIAGSGELSQKTEEIIGEYELNDFYMYHVLKYGFSAEKLRCLAEAAFKGKYGADKLETTLKAFFHRFTAAQFKRQASPDSPEVFGFSLSPRGGLVMSCDTENEVWK